MEKPMTRKEMYYNNLLGDTSITLPEPITREERYLYELCKNGIGGGGTTNYNDLQNLPSINGVELKGELSLEDIITNGNEVAY